MVSFNSVPTNLRVPFVSVEFDNSLASQGPALLAYRALLIGQKLPSATAAADSLQRVTNADQVATLAGRGSMLHRMALAYFDANQSTETWIGVLADAPSSVIASGTLTVTGPATADGVIYLYLGGERVPVAVASGDSANTIAASIAAAVGEHASGTVTCASAAAADTVTVGATTFTGATGAVTPGAATFSVDTSDTAAAASLVSQIKAHAVASTKVHPSSSSGLVTLRAVAGGTQGNAIVLTSSNGTRLAVTGAGTLTGGTAETDLAVHASVASAVVTLRANNGGAVQNEFDVRLNYNDGEALPAGVAVSIVDMASGASNPSLSGLIAAMGDTWFNILAHPYTDATNLTALENELASRNGPMRMIDGSAFCAKDDTYSSVATLGEGRNSPHNTIVRTNDSPTPPPEYAACVAGVVAIYGDADPARPFQTLPLSFVKAPALADRDTLQERNLLLYDGIATTSVGPGDLVQIDRLITTYQKNAANSPDTSYLDVNTMLTLMYARYSFRARMQSRYPRHKLADDGTRFGAGQAVMTPTLGKSEAIAWFQDLEELGLFEGIDQFKNDLIVERNESDPNRLDFLLPPNLINQLIVTAASIQFRL